MSDETQEVNLLCGHLTTLQKPVATLHATRSSAFSHDAIIAGRVEVYSAVHALPGNANWPGPRAL